MKTLKQLRNNKLTDRISKINIQLRSLAKAKIDFDVYLPSIGENLQRKYCWTLFQKQELIYSIFLERNISSISILSIIDYEDDSSDILQIIDGKQRLSSVLDFFNGKFSVILEGSKYFYNDLPQDYQFAIRNFHFHVNIIYDNYGSTISDCEKIEWFRLINFSGTPQDIKHMDKLTKKNENN